MDAPGRRVDADPLCERNYLRTAPAGIYRAADVGMVTPLRDGMNLVAKEYIAAQILTIPVSWYCPIRRRRERADRALISIRTRPRCSQPLKRRWT